VSQVFIHGIGAVSPAGWGVAALRAALATGEPLPVKELFRPGWTHPLRARQVPPANPRPAFLNHPRLRRTSPISQYAYAAAVEALGSDSPQVADGSLRLGVIFCVMSGCINYSRRFYDEALKDPATASPLVFPETVFNAPSSHLAAALGTTVRNYTLVGDPGTFLQGLALAADWLAHSNADACLVVGAEEMDWLSADAFRLFDRNFSVSEGAGAVYLKKAESAVQLGAVTDAQMFLNNQSRADAAQKMRAQLNDPAEGLLCDGLQNLPRVDAAEAAAWNDWQGARLSPKRVLGEGSMAAAAWQCVAAVDALQHNRYAAATVSVVGCNQQAIGARFVKA
jgi:3-oxoacyl-(acyl-carrier-protein) synthase